MKNIKLFKGFVGLFVCLAIVSSFFTALASVSVEADEFFPEKAEMTKQQRLEKTVYLQNRNYAAACDGVLTVINPNDKTITPTYIDGKFYIPLRFVLEYYGVVVSWEQETKTVVMTAGHKEYKLSTSDSVMSYGESAKSLPNPCYIERGTTFVAFDDISEIIGCNTYYFEEYKSGVILAGEAWNVERQAEKDALGAMEFAVSPFFKMFI